MKQANAVGRSSKTIREFLEKNHRDDMTRDETIKLTVKSLLEVVQTGAKNVEITVMDGFGKLKVLFVSLFFNTPRTLCSFENRRSSFRRRPLRVERLLTPFFASSCFPRKTQNLTLAEIEEVVKEIELEKEAEAEKKRSRLAATAASQQSMVTGSA